MEVMMMSIAAIKTETINLMKGKVPMTVSKIQPR